MALRLVALLAALGFVLTANLPQPGDLVFDLSVEEFEDYLDLWLSQEEPKWASRSIIEQSEGCILRVNGDLNEPQPLYISKQTDEFLVPTLNSGVIHLEVGEEVELICTGSARVLAHENILVSTQSATAKCVSGNIFSGEGWLSQESSFLDFKCSSNPQYVALATGETCYNGATIIQAGFDAEDRFYPSFFSCFDQANLSVLYTWYEQNPPHAVHQSSVSRPGWLVSTWFPGVGIDSRYTQVQQKLKVASLVGEELADKYITTRQYLARGHLCAKTDMIFASQQRSTFFFVNAAPQWQPFNGGNWNWLEQNLRQRIGQANYHTTVYTGTYGVTQLRNQQDELVDIYLYTDANNNNQLPVPLYFYKVVYDKDLKLGTAFVSINNPYYTQQEVEELTFCTNRCRNSPDFAWIGWQPDRIDIGYSFCCTIDEFRMKVPHLPEFEVAGLLF